jgi:GNAT superfamily N-acetyltransferase
LEYRITQYPLEQGALEIEYIEEFFGEFQRRKTAKEIVGRLKNRDHLILMATAPLPDDPGTVVPVSYKVAHEIRTKEDIAKLADLVVRLRDHVQFDGRKILYTWIGGTRRDWRGQGHFRALTEQQETWAIEHGFDEILVKTKNKFYEMRGTLDHLRFDVVKYEPHLDNRESKVYLGKKLGPSLLDTHRSMKTVVTVGDSE